MKWLKETANKPYFSFVLFHFTFLKIKTEMNDFGDLMESIWKAKAKKRSKRIFFEQKTQLGEKNKTTSFVGNACSAEATMKKGTCDSFM